MRVSTEGSAHRRFKDGAPGSPEPDPTGPRFEPGDPFTPNTGGPWGSLTATAAGMTFTRPSPQRRN